MEPSLRPMDVRGADRTEFISFMTQHEFPFHVRRRPSVEHITEAIDAGRFDDDDHEVFWVDESSRGRVGVVVLEDLTDDAPLFDLRLATEHRGAGLGLPILRALTTAVFERFPEVNRFEGQTREDNVAMRKTFLRAGFVKEAHYREGWPVDGGKPLASVAYAILRRDWRNGTVTTFEWEDLRV